MINKGKQAERHKADYTSVDYYNYYKEKHFGKNTESKFSINKKDYTQVLKDFFDLVIEDLIMTGNEFKLPFNVGSLQIRKVKKTIRFDENGEVINRLPIDFGATMKLRRENPEAEKNKVIIRHINKHTNGYVYSFKYIKRRVIFKNKTSYSFKVTRTNRLKLKEAVRIHKNKIDFLKLY